MCRCRPGDSPPVQRRFFEQLREQGYYEQENSIPEYIVRVYAPGARAEYAFTHPVRVRTYDTNEGRYLDLADSYYGIGIREAMS